MKVKIALTALIMVLCSRFLFAQEDVKAVKIIKFNREYSFIVIDQGSIHGITPGMEFMVIKDGVEVGKIETVKVKDNVSACDIRELMEGVNFKENDVITIYPLSKMLTSAEIKASKKKREATSSEEAGKKSRRKGVFMPDNVKGRSLQEVSWMNEVKGETISLDILANKNLTFYILKETLQENNIVVTNSNRIEGMLTAFEMMSMSWWSEIFADFKGFRDKKVVYNIVVREKGPQTSNVEVGVKYIIYDRKENPRVGVLKSGKQVQKIQKILNKVKVKTEKLQTEWGD